MPTSTVTAVSAGLKAWQLKYCAFLTGSVSTGRKQQLESSLLSHLSERRISKPKCRILSVDMGIKNLAYCVLDTHFLDPDSKAKKSTDPRMPPTAVAWQKVDVLADANSIAGEEPKQAKQIKRQIANSAFTPSALSKTAYQITQTLLSHRPDIVLIERQRFRSGGASAIQEWTVRVNMLESMLWACLETLQRSGGSKAAQAPEVFEVSPKRVGSFWTAGDGGELKVPDEIFLDLSSGGDPGLLKHVKRKVEKKDKIAVVKSWLKGEGGVELAFSDEVKEAVDSFGILRGSGAEDGDGRGSKKRVAASKLDDLADCMLQAMAWVRWEENSRRLKRLGETAKLW